MEKKIVVEIDNMHYKTSSRSKRYTIVDERRLNQQAYAGVLRPGKNNVQVIIGTKVQFVADEFKKLCK